MNNVTKKGLLLGVMLLVLAVSSTAIIHLLRQNIKKQSIEENAAP